MEAQPLLIAKQMAAHNPFLQEDHFNCTHQWPGNDRLTFMEKPPTETVNTGLIQMDGLTGMWPSLAESCRCILKVALF